MNGALKSKGKAEEIAKSSEEKLATLTTEKEAVELERDSLKERNVQLEEEVKECKGALAKYFDDGFERAREQAKWFYPEADFSGLDAFKIVEDGKLVDEE